jgi:hypothetical protein
MKKIHILSLSLLVALPLTAAQYDISTDDLSKPDPVIVVGHIANIVEHAVVMSEDKNSVGPHIAGIFANVLGIVLQIAQNRNIHISQIDHNTIAEYAQDFSPNITRNKITIDIDLYTNDIDETDPKIVVSHIAQIIEHSLEMSAGHNENIAIHINSIFFNILGIILEVAKCDLEILSNNDALMTYIDAITPAVEHQVKRIKG